MALLRYISASGGEPPGQEFDLKSTTSPRLRATAQDGLAAPDRRVRPRGTPYRAVRRARFHYDYDDYAHLARVAEWSVDSADGGGRA